MLQFNIDEIEKRTLSGLKDFQRATVMKWVWEKLLLPEEQL